MIKKITIHLMLLSLFVLPVFMHAQTAPPPPVTTNIDINIPNPTTAGSTLMEVITSIVVNVVTPRAAVRVGVWIIYSGFMYVMAQGNEKKVTEAHQQLLWSLVGAGILLGAAGIAKVVETTVTALIRPN